MRTTGITDYLLSLFTELDKRQPSHNHALTYRDGAIIVLVGTGDVRVGVRVDALDSDPAQAAENVIKKWGSMTDTEKYFAMEECR